jgi:hypothetical protein
MKKSNQFTSYDPDNAEQSELYWDQNILEEDTTCHEKRTGRQESRSKAKVKRKVRKPIRKIYGDDSIED